MRIPRKAPKLPELLKAIEPSRLDSVLQSVSATRTSNRYLHWDKLIRYPPPNGLTKEEWWLGQKLLRIPNMRYVALLDKEKSPFSFMLPDVAIELLHEIDLRAGGTISMPDQIVNPELKDRYYISTVMEEAITSSQLEGATTTRRVAKEMIRSGRAPRDRSERMILNNYHTMLLVEKLKEKRLTKELVFEIHRRITEKTLDDEDCAGRFRKDHERIIVGDEYDHVYHVPPKASELEDRIQAMCEFANGESPDYFLHPVIRAIILHFWLAYDHPFVDGNGRTARALFYWSMVRHGYWLAEFISISSIIKKARSDYERAFLYTETDDNDLTYFVLYHLETIHDAVEELHKFIQRKTKELSEIERDLKGLAHFNFRQRSLLGHALRHPNYRYTFEGHRVSHGIVHQTARTDLLELKNRGLFTADKIGQRWYFTPMPDLSERLEQLSRGSTRQLLLP